MSNHNAQMERTPDVDRNEVEAAGEVIVLTELGDGHHALGTEGMSICLSTLADNTSVNAASEASPAPATHTLPTAAAITVPVSSQNETNSSFNSIIPDVDQKDWVSGNSDQMFDISHGIFPPNMPGGSPTSALSAWPSDDQLAKNLIEFAREEAVFDTVVAGMMLEDTHGQLSKRRSTAIERREHERPNTENPYNLDAHGLTEMDRLQLEHVDYIRLYRDPLAPNTDEEKNYQAAQAALEKAQAWRNKVEQWKIPAVDSEIFRYFWTDRFMQLLKERGRYELLRGLKAEMQVIWELANRIGREVARGDIPQVDGGSSSPPPTNQGTIRDAPGPVSNPLSSSALNPTAAPFQPGPQTLAEAHHGALFPTTELATAAENDNPPSDEIDVPTPFPPLDHPTPRAPHHQQQPLQ